MTLQPHDFRPWTFGDVLFGVAIGFLAGLTVAWVTVILLRGSL